MRTIWIKLLVMTAAFCAVMLISGGTVFAFEILCTQTANTDSSITFEAKVTTGPYETYYRGYTIICTTTNECVASGAIPSTGNTVTKQTFTHAGLQPLSYYSYRVIIQSSETSWECTSMGMRTAPVTQTGGTATTATVGVNFFDNTSSVATCVETGQTINIPASGSDLSYNNTQYATFTGLSPSETYHVNVSRNSTVVRTCTLYTLGTMSVTSKGRQNWANQGTGYVALSWPAMPGAKGYKLWINDGGNYRSFNVGNVTSWDSRVAKIFPTNAYLNSASYNSLGDVFDRSGYGQDLADSPNLLYKKTSGTTYDNDNCYYFALSAYYDFFETSHTEIVPVTLPNASDAAPPQISGIQIEDGTANAAGQNIALDITAMDPVAANYTADTNDDASGIAKYQISNDGFTTWTDVPTTSTLLQNYSWSLTAGEGQKTVSVRAIDAAGNTSAVKSATINLINDVTPPTVSVTINNGETQTDSRYASLVISANDNLTTVDKLQLRVSMDGTSWYSYNGTSWVSGWGTYSAVTDSFDLGTDGGRKYIYIQVKDLNGNIGNALTSVNLINTVVQPKITGGLNLSINAGTTTATTDNENLNGKVVMVNGVAMEVSQGDTATLGLTGLQNVAHVSVSNDGIVWSPKDSLASGATAYTREITFSGEGTKTVYLKFYNQDGSESGMFTKRYLVDKTAPEISAYTVSGAKATSSASIQFQLNAKDNVSPVTKLKYSVNGGGYNTLPSDGVISASLSSGLNSVRITVVDQAGNIANTTVNVWRL